jgi:MinD superfamily P-loop ATPase
MQSHSPVQLACFDVEKPDLIALPDPEKLISEAIYAPLPVIDISKCRYCGVCSGYCPEKAIQFNRFVPSVTLIVSRCFACGNCMKNCSRNGIKMQEKLSGKILQGRMNDHYFIAGQLTETSEFKIPLISALINRLNPETTVICDFEPGTGSSVSLGIAEMDVAAIVLNPGPGWEQNLDLMLAMVEKIGIPAGVILNKVKHESAFAGKVKAFCASHSLPLLGIIPFDKSLENGLDYTITFKPENVKKVFTEIWDGLFELLPTSIRMQKETLK